MKKAMCLLIGVSLLFLAGGCTDGGGVAYVTVINQSSYDLNISFGGDQDFSVNRGESYSFEMSFGFGHDYPDPNYRIERIIFSDPNSGNIIKECETMDRGLFVLTKTESAPYGEKAYFVLEITDDLLFP